MGRPRKDPLPQPELRPIEVRRSSVSQEVIKALTEYFFSGDLTPGHRLPSERQLAEQLGVSRSAVRDAIQSLGLLGILDIRQGDGTYLRGMGSDLLPAVVEWGLFLGERRLMDLVEARQQLEMVLAGLAASRRSEEQLAEMKRLLDAMAAPEITPQEFVELDIEYHFTIAQAADNTALADVLRSITSLLRAWMSRSIRAAGETHSSYQEHVEVYDAIASGRARSSSAAMRRHLTKAERRLKSTLKDDPLVRESPGQEAGHE